MLWFCVLWLSRRQRTGCVRKAWYGWAVRWISMRWMWPLGLGPRQTALPLWLQAHGNTALHMAAALPPGPPQEAIVRHLLAAGADPTLRNLENEQPVHLLRPGPGPEAVSTGLTSGLARGFPQLHPTPI